LFGKVASIEQIKSKNVLNITFSSMVFSQRLFEPAFRMQFMLRFYALFLCSLGLLGCQDKTSPIVVIPPDQGSAEMWSNPATWGGTVPSAETAVVVPLGKRIVLDTSTTVKNITVLGTLEVQDKNLDLQTDYIAVQGAFKVGSAINPFSSKLQITLSGNATENIMNMGSRGLLVMGTLELHGTPPVTTWTKLADHAGAGSSSLALLAATGWKTGDQIVIAPTDFYNDGNFVKAPITEQLEVLSVSGSNISSKNALVGSRWGKLQYATNNGISLTQGAVTLPDTSKRDTGGTTIPTVLDERAEVGNLSRNIVIQAADDTLWQQQKFGAHIMIMGADAKAVLNGVELRRVGQAGKFGRYPVHFHNMSYDSTGKELPDANAILSNSSIHNSAQRCVVIHGSNGVKVQNNICFDIRGHGIFLEDAVERRNLLENNLVLKVREPFYGAAAPSTCPMQTVYGKSERNCALLQHERHDGDPSGFWIVNPDNTTRGNAVADIEGHGYWLAFPTLVMGSNKNVSLNNIKARPDNLPFGVFEDNVAHSVRNNGVHLDNVPKNSENGELEGNKYIPTTNGVVYDYTNGLRFTLARVTTYKTGNYWGGGGGIWNRNSKPNFVEWVSADHQGGWFDGAGDDGLIARSLIVAESLNKGVARQSPQPLAALASYHSTFDMTQNIVVGFGFTDDSNNSASGVFKTADYYITAVDKGLKRNPDNTLIGSHPGRRVQPFTSENWTLAGALWDAHGYWGAKGNYWVYDQPFFTTGTSCTQVAPAGKNGASCAGNYYAIGGYKTDFDPSDYSFKHPIEATRVDTNGNPIGVWSVGDGNTAPKLGNMRHFAALKDGRFVLRFPKRSGSGYDIPKSFNATVGNFLTASDSVLFAVAFDGTLNPAITLSTGAETREIKVSGDSVAAVEADASGKTYFFDRPNNLLWVRLVGGLKANPYWQQEPNSDDQLYKPMRLEVK
jgi:G8 domain